MITVSESVIIKRINRRLTRDGERLRTLRSERDWPTLGTFYIVDQSNAVVYRHVDLEQLGRELGALRPGEGLAA
jgi:hypothetical protein